MDDNGHVVENEYDDLNRVTKETSPLSKVTLFTWDEEGNMATRKDPLLRTTTYTHDVLNRLTQIAYPNGQNLTATYDAEGNTLTAVGFGYTRTHAWDELGRVTSIEFDYGSYSKTVNYTYDEVGNRKTLQYPEGQTLTSTYDALNRLTKIQDSSLGNWTFAYDAASRRTSLVHPTGVKTQYTYNDADWLLGVYTNKSGGQQLESFVYTYDDVGNRLTITELGGSATTFAYDGTYRLKDSSYPGSLTLNYTYDGVGNRLTEKRNGVWTNYSYDADDRMTARGSTTYGWDDNGNMANETTGGATTTYEYDYENRLSKVTVAGNNAVEYTYGVQNNRMTRKVGGTTTFFAYDFYDQQHLDDLIAEYNATGGLQVRYVHGPGADETLARVSAATRYYNAEAQSSTTPLTDNTQSITSTSRYEAFGTIRSQTGSDTNDQLFTGRIRDSATSLFSYRARWYSVTTGRFTTDEPWRQTPEPNPYVYVLNNPGVLVDPLGLSAKGGTPRPGGDVIPRPCWPVPCINGVPDQPNEMEELSDEYWEGSGCGIPLPIPPLIPYCAGCTFTFASNWNNKWRTEPWMAVNDKFLHCWVSCSLVQDCWVPPSHDAMVGVAWEVMNTLEMGGAALSTAFVMSTISDIAADMDGIECAISGSSCVGCCINRWGSPWSFTQGRGGRDTPGPPGRGWEP